MPAIAGGQVDFGVANQYEVLLALTASEYFQNRGQPTLRAVAVLFPLRIATYVQLDSPVVRIADLEGRRMPDGYVANKIILPLIDATLTTSLSAKTWCDNKSKAENKNLDITGIADHRGGVRATVPRKDRSRTGL